MMKKLICLILALALCLGISACGREKMADFPAHTIF